HDSHCTTPPFPTRRSSDLAWPPHRHRQRPGCRSARGHIGAETAGIARQFWNQPPIISRVHPWRLTCRTRLRKKSSIVGRNELWLDRKSTRLNSSDGSI